MKDGKKYSLVADDDREIREIVSLLLSSEGYAVLTAEDGIQAARLAIQVHHAVCDGYHIGVFVEKLQGYIDQF